MIVCKMSFEFAFDPKENYTFEPEIAKKALANAPFHRDELLAGSSPQVIEEAFAESELPDFPTIEEIVAEVNRRLNLLNSERDPASQPTLSLWLMDTSQPGSPPDLKVPENFPVPYLYKIKTGECCHRYAIALNLPQGGEQNVRSKFPSTAGGPEGIITATLDFREA